MKNFPALALGIAAMLPFSACNAPQSSNRNALTFNPEAFELQSVNVDGKTLQIRAYEGIVYVETPVDTAYQQMNIYIPAEYFDGKTLNGYSAETAPVFFPNQVGGYMPATAGTAVAPKGARGMGSATIAAALARGYVVASAGARGRTSPLGKAPAAIIDLKAAVRYLKFNDKRMAGDASKIISNGTSAGGALSVLLGATGNNADFEPYLNALGAAKADDHIFAVSAYCPITNLNHADMAYEWQFNGVNDYKKIEVSMLDYNVQRKETAGTLDASQQQISDELKALFPAYVNGLQLKDNHGRLLALNENGNGSFKDWVKSHVVASANAAMANGTDLSHHAWLKMENGTVVDVDFSAYVHYMERMKTPPAFDALDLSAGENQLFGDTVTDAKHFTAFSAAHSAVNAAQADAHIVKMMNPMSYIGTPSAAVSAHWRIRHGTKDKDTGLAVSVLLATLLQNSGCAVNFALPWDKPHSGDYDLNELFAWIDEVVKTEKK